MASLALGSVPHADGVGHPEMLIEHRLQERLGGVVGFIQSWLSAFTWLLDTYCPLGIESSMLLLVLLGTAYQQYRLSLNTFLWYQWLRWRNEYELTITSVTPAFSRVSRNESLMRAVLVHIAREMKEDVRRRRTSQEKCSWFDDGAACAQEGEEVKAPVEPKPNATWSVSGIVSAVADLLELPFRVDQQSGSSRSLYFLLNSFVRTSVDSSFDLREDSDDDSSDKSERLSFGDLGLSAKELRRKIITKLPVGGSFVYLGDGIYHRYTRYIQQESHNRRITEELTLITRRKDGDVHLQEFVSKCLDQYLDTLPKGPRNARYLMELMGSSPKQRRGPQFSRFKLSDHTTFDTLFFPEKENMLKLVDDFMNRQGRFSVDGFPQKLGFLLHGPSGTGKTSFVKALATYTRRHVVVISLDRVSTNQELFDIFFDRTFSCVGEGSAVKLDMNEVIFLLEDVAASSDLIRSRVRSRLIRRMRPARLTAAGGDGGGPATRGDDDDAMDDVRIIINSPEEDEERRKYDAVAPWYSSLLSLPPAGAGRDAASSGPPLTPSRQRSAGAWRHGGFLDSDLSRGPGLGTAGLFGSLGVVADKLDLSGLLNVLDGAIDTPGRIVVMTTTQPELLDPALVRPGRISTILKMDYLRLPCLLRMLGLHFGDPATRTLSTADVERVVSCIGQLEVELVAGEVGTLREVAAAPRGHNHAHEAIGVEAGRDPFSLAPSEVELLCAATESLEECLDAIRAQIRKQHAANQASPSSEGRRGGLPEQWRGSRA